MFLNLFRKLFSTVVAMIIFSGFSVTAQALDSATPSNTQVDTLSVEQAVVEQITAKINKLKLAVTSVTPAAVDGLYEVLTDRGIFYVSKNGQYLLQGNIYDLNNNMENISEKSLVAVRKKRLKAFEKDMIVYKAPQEQHVITVFTDSSCSFCRKLHAQMADYNKLGITVRYLAFPRGGLQSSAYHTMTSIWCADNQKQAMDNAKKGREIEPKTCTNTIQEQYELGLFFGVNGTPAIILEDGSLQPGYIPADRLLQLLEQK